MAKKQRSSRKQQTNLVIKCLIVGMFLAGIGVFSYPFFVDSLNNYLDQKMVEKHQQETTERNQKNQEQALKKMAAENAKQSAEQRLPNGLIEELFDPADFQGNHSAEYYEERLLGAIYIPKIRTSLPIFNETNPILLEKGATLLQGTSYPIGGTSTHSVITGHTGLPEKMIFTDLEKLQYGDQFYIDILGERLAYQVSQIKVVSPDNLDVLAVQEGQDLVTLLTCTPYMINSHRLLVTGERIPYKEKMEAAINQTKRYQFWRLVGLIALITGIFVGFLYWLWRKIVLVRAAKQTYTIRFFDTELNLRKFQLVQKDGTPVLKNGRPLIEQASEQGEVCFSEIPGGIYLVIDPKKHERLLKAKVWRVKDQTFRLIGKKGNKLAKKEGNYLLTSRSVVK
ncbi:class C sortase [Enterococcus xiangfangensis]|uniref:Class C sortase n=1 Tax=Enterococcus xiangfangensis TaxID=1296537 RepID=A0ABU3FB60_9ENTE|nr:class C sortase [Enterococcus xiangfangensis]MDT2759730.1 class C sortase [Enterococcus xiangfangensis]